MITLFAQHEVEDFDKWLQAGELAKAAEQGLLEQLGIVETSRHRQVGKSGVIVTHKFNDLETAQNFVTMFETPETKARLKGMGAIMPVTLWLGEGV